MFLILSVIDLLDWREVVRVFLAFSFGLQLRSVLWVWSILSTY